MKKQHIVLYLVGVALSIAQFVMIRDFVTILYGEEVVIVLVTASFFIGLSVGYLLSLRISTGVFQLLFGLSIFLHLSFPFSYRYLASWLSTTNVAGYWYLVLLFLYALIFNAIFATFLPRLINTGENGRGPSEESRLRTYYSLELAGFMSGFIIVASTWDKPLDYLLIPYWCLLGLMLLLVLHRWILTGVYASVLLLVIIFFNRLDYHSTALLYEYKHGIRDAKVLYSMNSPYQKVEVIEDKGGTRYLYLDGLANLNSTDLDSLNYYIAEIPATLIKPEKTLLIGNGTLSSVPRVYPHSGGVVSVELDSGVLLAGKRHFTPVENLQDFDRWRLYVDDGKHFLRKSQEYYDLVVIDVPSPLTIQEAYLHSVEFYQLVRERLTDSGVIAVQLSGPLQKNNRTPARVTAALHEVFSDVLVIYSDRADRGFAYGSMQLPFSDEDLMAQTRDYEEGIDIIQPSQVKKYLATAVPLSVNSMDLVLKRGLERFTGRYFDQ